jgi:Tfp pilus assembly protein PilE
MTVRNNNKKGMTLVELIISSVVTVIVISAACSVLYFGYSNYMSGTTDLSNHQNASLLEDYLQHDLSTATSVTVGAEQTSVNTSADVQSAGDKMISMHFENKVLFIVEKDSSGREKSTAKITGIESIQLTEVNALSSTSSTGASSSLSTSKKLAYVIKASDKAQTRSFLLNGGVVLNNISKDSQIVLLETSPKKVELTCGSKDNVYVNIQMPDSAASSATS